MSAGYGTAATPLTSPTFSSELVMKVVVPVVTSSFEIELGAPKRMNVTAHMCKRLREERSPL
jgi:hypothetical protein